MHIDFHEGALGEAQSDSTGEGCSSAKAASRRSHLWRALNEPIQCTSIVTPLFFRLMNVLRRFALSSRYCRRSEKGITWSHHASGRKTVPSQERNWNIDKATMFVVGYSRYEWACLKERFFKKQAATASGGCKHFLVTRT